MNIVDITNQMLSLFMLLIMGYIAFKVHITSDEAIRNLTRLVLNVSLPAQVLVSFLSNRGKVSNMDLLEGTGVCLLSYAIYVCIALVFLVLTRAPKKQWGTYIFMLMFGNVGFMGYPVIQSIFGMEAMIYAVLFNVTFCLLAYSVGILMIGGKSAGKINLKQMVNAPMILSVISLILFFTDIPMPVCVEDTLHYLGELTTPLAMIIIGGIIAQMQVKEIFDDWRMFVFTAVRLLAAPAVILLVMNLIHEQQFLIRGTAVVLAGTPVATNATMLAIQYDGDVHMVSKGIFFSTILSVVTIPIVTMWL